MVLLHVTVLYLVVFKSKCAQTDACSQHGLFPGIAKDRETLSKGKSLILYDVDPSTCDDGIRCMNICLNSTLGWNYVEVRVLIHGSAFFPNSGYGHDCNVRVFQRVKSTNHSILIVSSLSLHQWI